MDSQAISFVAERLAMVDDIRFLRSSGYPGLYILVRQHGFVLACLPYYALIVFVSVPHRLMANSFIPICQILDHMISDTYLDISIYE